MQLVNVITLKGLLGIYGVNLLLGFLLDAREVMDEVTCWVDFGMQNFGACLPGFFGLLVCASCKFL